MITEFGAMALLRSGHTPEAIAVALLAAGHPPAEAHVFEHLGGSEERHVACALADLPGRAFAPLNVLELEKLVGYVNSVTGWNMSLFEMLKVGERANTLQRLFNCREGFGPADDEGATEPLASELAAGTESEEVLPGWLLAAVSVDHESTGNMNQ